MTGYGRRHWRQKIRTSSAAAWPPQHARCRWDTPCSTCLASYGSLAALCSMLLALSLRSTSYFSDRATYMCWVAFPGNRRTCHIDVPATAAGFCHTTPRKFSHGLVSCTRHEAAPAENVTSAVTRRAGPAGVSGDGGAGRRRLRADTPRRHERGSAGRSAAHRHRPQRWKRPAGRGAHQAARWCFELRRG